MPSKKKPNLSINKVSKKSGMGLLKRELTRLKSLTGLGSNLAIKWDPRSKLLNKDHGIVKGSIIHIFDLEKDEALRTLRHEFWDYVLTNDFLEPRIFEAKAHRRSDALVDVLAKLI